MIDFQRLKDIREDNDINQNQMAKILGTPRSTYSLWEIGISIIPIKHLVNFANYFNISIEYALGLTNIKEKNELIKLDLIQLGNNIKHLRKQHNLSQNELALLLGVTQSCITKYEKGKRYIPTEKLYKLAKKFNITITKLCSNIE